MTLYLHNKTFKTTTLSEFTINWVTSIKLNKGTQYLTHCVYIHQSIKIDENLSHQQ